MSGLLTRRFAELSHGRSDWLAVLHAAAVGDEPAARSCCPGPNSGGKSTLTAALLARGCGYFSDDCVPIDGDGLVQARCPSRSATRTGVGRGCGSPISCRPGRRLRRRRRGCSCSRASGPGSRPEARRLAPPEVLERLVAGRAWLSRRPEHMRRALALLAATPAFELTYASTEAALALVADCHRTEAA